MSIQPIPRPEPPIPEPVRQPRRKGLLDPGLVPTPLVPDRPRLRIAGTGDSPPPFRLLRMARPVLTIYLELTGLPRDPEGAARSGRAVREAMETLGGFWVKAGQILSLRTDVFPVEFCEELARLADRVHALPESVARQIVETDLGRPIRAVFDEFDEIPYASGSIGQVHRARLAGSGIWVSVKVQRPDARETFRRDLRFIHLLIRFLNRSARFRHFRWMEALKELRQIFVEELDYRYEADALRTMKKDAKRHGRVHFPKVFDELTTPRVLVMEHLQGVYLSDYLKIAREDPDRARTWLEANGVAPRKVARRLFRSFLRQVFEDHYFHGDLQPANILLFRDSWVGFVDCGTIGRLDRETLTNLNDVFRLIGWRDYDNAAQKILALAEPLPAIDPNDFRIDLLRVFRGWDQRTYVREFPYDAKSLVALWHDISSVGQRYQILFNWSLLRVDRALMGLDIGLRELWTGVEYPSQLKKHFIAAEGRYLRSMRSCKKVLELGGRWSQFLRETPAQFQALQRDLGTLYQRRATNFQASSSKLAFLFERAFSECRFLVTMAMLGLGLTFVHQKLWEFRWPRVTDHRLDDVFLVFPVLTLPEWGFLFLVFGWAWVTFHRLTRRFARKDSQLPGAQGAQ